LRVGTFPKHSLHTIWRFTHLRTRSALHRGANPMKRAVLYTRVSTFDQNPETQALDLRRLAEQRGFEIVHEYTDRISGAKAKRYGEPRPTYLGIAILIAAASIMPWLAREKRRLSGAPGSAALRADAAQSALC